MTEEPGGRLSGPDAGWRNMLRNLAAADALADAESYAHGERRLTVHHGLRHGSELDKLREVVDEALLLPGQRIGYPSATYPGQFTRWRFKQPGAVERLEVARSAVDRVNPGHWRVEADQH